MGRVRAGTLIVAAACAHAAPRPLFPSDGRPHAALGGEIPRAIAIDLVGDRDATYEALQKAILASGASTIGLVAADGHMVEAKLGQGSQQVIVTIEASIATVGEAGDPAYRGSLLGIRDVIARLPADAVVFQVDPGTPYDVIVSAIELVAPRPVVLR